jgi:hypothetical protein
VKDDRGRRATAPVTTVILATGDRPVPVRATSDPRTGDLVKDDRGRRATALVTTVILATGDRLVPVRATSDPTRAVAATPVRHDHRARAIAPRAVTSTVDRAFRHATATCPSVTPRPNVARAVDRRTANAN